MTKHVLLCAAATLLTTTVASASVTFSFASDSHEGGPVFQGENVLGQNQLSTFLTPAGVSLLVDPDSNVPGGVTAFDAIFSIAANTIDYQMSSFGGISVHQWVMSGSFNFVDANTNADILTISFNQAVLTNVSSSPTALGSSATLQTSFDIDPGLTFTAGSALNMIGITSADISSMQDFAFTLTNIRALVGGGLPGLGAGGDWSTTWTSEASFSASAIPAPSVLGLLGLAGLISRRRRR